MDFGRIMVSPRLVVYLFGTPGQERFWFMWNDLVHGALGAVVLADTRRLESSFASIDFFESRRIPFVVGVNCFHGRRDRDEGEVREALDLDPDVPLMMGDMRERSVGRDLLLSLADHLIRTNSIT
jgi:signal recognition particle receptor subunit beta